MASQTQRCCGGSQKGKQAKGTEKLPLFLLSFFFFFLNKQFFGQGCISEESPALVAPLIMNGPQAGSRWARQPRPRLRHFKKPLVGPVPSPSSHSGRSEAPENSETSPREKGNLCLPVLLTDGSTHLEQIVGSEQGLRCVATPAESSRELNGPKTPRRARAQEGGAEEEGSVGAGGKGHWCRRIAQRDTWASRVALPYCTRCEDSLQQLEFAGW